MALRIGEPVRNLTFVRSDGTILRLDAFIGRPLLLILLRHLA